MILQMSSHDAEKREEAAAKLTDFEIWYQVLTKLAVMEMPVEMRVDMLMQTIGDDMRMILAVLHEAVNDLSLNTDLVKEVLEVVESKN